MPGNWLFEIGTENRRLILAPAAMVHFMVPYLRNERFIPGNQKSGRIREKLAEQKLSHHRRLAIYGLGGVGYCNPMRSEAKGLADLVQ